MPTVRISARFRDVCDECFTDIDENRKQIQQYLEANT